MVRRSARTAKNARTSATPETENASPPSPSPSSPVSSRGRRRSTLQRSSPKEQSEQPSGLVVSSNSSIPSVSSKSEAAAAVASDPPTQAPDASGAQAVEAKATGEAEAEMRESGEKANDGDAEVKEGEEKTPGEAEVRGGEDIVKEREAEWYLILTEDAMAVLRSQQKQQEAQSQGEGSREEHSEGHKREEGDKREGETEEEKGGDRQGVLATGNESSVVGPVSAETVRIYFQHCLVDGYTQCWKPGMPAWLPLCSTDELKKVLQEADEGDLEEAQEDGGEKEGQTARLEDVPPEFKYVTPEGVRMVFDLAGKTWRTAEEYEALCSLLAEAEALPAASPEKHESAVAENREDMVFPGLSEEEVDRAEGEGEQGRTRELTEAERQKKEANAEKRRMYRQRLKKKKQEGRWVAGRKNPNIYVANLPADCTEEELAEIFKKAGVFKIDPETLRPKIRVYTDDTGRCKGDALISFVHENSVDIAIKYFDGFSFRDGACTLKVQRAEFAPKAGQGTSPKTEGSEGGSAESRTGKRDRRKYLAAKYEQERLLSWGDAIDDGSGRRIIILKPTYSSEEAELYEEGDAFYEELRQELFDEIAQFAKPEKVTVIPRHVQGVACVKLKTAEDAERIIEQFRGRYFDGRQLDVFFFDGRSDLKANCLPSRLKKPKAVTPVTPQAAGDTQEAEAAVQNEGATQEKHDIEEEKDDEEERLDKFGEWISQQSSDEEFEVQTEE
ncbi:RNA recognition motif-containing protein [Toxoplasma gondii VAND]|uniref:RNA recognition motif-containing protein n=4 Tax=Toxoplasma gondii TaxID=5811 RepID=A0A3R8A9E7_TOXGO|nr:RNA recognition motif-containing protein [Toxoplasma gondii VAND]RQX69915.1 RNA recognition motif-containing protein [Toxoplasma gondii CAST]